MPASPADPPGSGGSSSNALVKQPNWWSHSRSMPAPPAAAHTSARSSASCKLSVPACASSSASCACRRRQQTQEAGAVAACAAPPLRHTPQHAHCASCPPGAIAALRLRHAPHLCLCNAALQVAGLRRLCIHLLRRLGLRRPQTSATRAPVRQKQQQGQLRSTTARAPAAVAAASLLVLILMLR